MEHMMLLVTYRMLPGQRDAFLQEVAAAGILAKVQQEDGFERYDYYLSAADPDELLIVEEWDSEAQQQAYRLAEQIRWDGCFYRHDIGYRAIARERGEG